MTAAIRITFRDGLDAHRPQVFAALAITMALAVIAPFYKREIAEALRAWVDSPTYNHCFLVIPIVFYLVWNRRGTIAGLSPRPALVGVLVIMGLSVLWCVAAKLDVIEARQFLFIAIVEGILFTLLGSTLYFRLLGPFLYLFFLVPSGEYLVPKLQELTANLAIAGLEMVRVPVYSNGIFIQIPEGSFVVADACAGLRFLVASIAYGVFFALIVYSSWWRRVAFIGLSLVIPVIANGMRAFGIIFAAHLVGSAAAVEADHILYGWLFFSIVIFFLTLAGMSFADRPILLSAGSEGELRPAVLGRSTRTLVTAGVLATALAICAPALLTFIQGRVVSPETAWLNVPKPTPPWKLSTSAPEWHPAVAGPDREFLDTFTNGQGMVERYVALLVSHGDNNIMRDLGRPAAGTKSWERGNIKTAQVRIGDRLRDVEVSVIRSESGQQRLLWSFYIVDRNTFSSALFAKLREAYVSLTGGGRAVAYVAVSTPVGSADIDHQAELQQFVTSMSSLESYIDAIN
jgi:exosortase A